MFKNIAMMVEKAQRSLAEELGRTITFDIPSGLPILNVDAEMLAKALNKLVENAVRHAIAPRLAPGRIQLSASREGNVLRLRVINCPKMAQKRAAVAGGSKVKQGGVKQSGQEPLNVHRRWTITVMKGKA